MRQMTAASCSSRQEVNNDGPKDLRAVVLLQMGQVDSRRPDAFPAFRPSSATFGSSWPGTLSVRTKTREPWLARSPAYGLRVVSHSVATTAMSPHCLLFLGGKQSPALGEHQAPNGPSVDHHHRGTIGRLKRSQGPRLWDTDLQFGCGLHGVALSHEEGF
jgi:hypothetical protein